MHFCVFGCIFGVFLCIFYTRFMRICMYIYMRVTHRCILLPFYNNLSNDLFLSSYHCMIDTSCMYYTRDNIVAFVFLIRAQDLLCLLVLSSVYNHCSYIWGWLYCDRCGYSHYTICDE